ncbi:MAG: PilN domain-containing protein [Acidobacteriota bacterium]
MIRINLLRQSSQKTRAWSFQSSQMGLYSAILLITAFLGVGWWYWQLLEQREEGKVVIEQLQTETLRLQGVKSELERFEGQKLLLEERIAVIERLKSNQKGPVLLMNALINSIPEEPRLWLTNMSQNESLVTIEGKSFDVPSIADFIANLNNSSPFRLVELSYWEEEEGAIKFELNCEVGN